MDSAQISHTSLPDEVTRPFQSRLRSCRPWAIKLKPVAKASVLCPQSQ